VAHQHRVNCDGVPMDDAEFKRRTKQWFGDEQAHWPPVPVGIFTEKMLRRMRRSNMVSTLQVWGLDCRQRTPDLPAIERFLVERYGYATDDIEHEDPFASSPRLGSSSRILLPGGTTPPQRENETSMGMEKSA
jgi:hypothetical protein